MENARRNVIMLEQVAKNVSQKPVCAPAVEQFRMSSANCIDRFLRKDMSILGPTAFLISAMGQNAEQ